MEDVRDAKDVRYAEAPFDLIVGQSPNPWNLRLETLDLDQSPNPRELRLETLDLDLGLTIGWYKLDI